MKRNIAFSPVKYLSIGFTMLVMLAAAPVYSQSVPAISSVTPNSGIVGGSVTISGANLSATAASNIVYFGAVQAAVTAASATNLTVTMPTGATFAPVTVAVNGLTAYANQPFLPTFPGIGQITNSSLAARLDLATGAGPGQVVIGDLDGDGKPDLIIADSYDAKISLYRNVSTNGSLTAGSFAARVDLSLLLPSSGQTPFTVAAADLDGDGRLDLIALNADSNVVSILRNIGSPGSLTTNSFAARIDLPAGTSLRGLAVQDLNGDGKPEIVTTSQTSPGSMAVFQNLSTIGNIAFAPPVNFVAGNGSASVAIGDLDGDGQPDLVVGNYADGTISIFRNTGAGNDITTNSLAAKVDFPAVATCFPIAIGDLDGDGKLDLVVGGAQGSQAISVYRNTSTAGSITASSFAARVDFAAPGWVNSLKLGDLDGDGKLDIAVTSQSPDALSIFKNVSGPGSFTTASLAARVDYSAGSNPVGIAIGDLDGDGRPDIIFGNFYDGTLSIYQNVTPFGTNTPPPPACTPAPSGLVGWWKGEGNTLDSVAANNGVNQNVAYSNGVVGQAFAFDPENLAYGTYSGIQIADQPAYALTNSLTIEGWIRPRGDSYMIFWRGDQRPGLDPYFLSMQSSNTIFGICDAGGNSAFVEAPVNYFAWTHLAATLEGASGMLSIYTNGVLAVQTNTSIRPFGSLLAGQSPGVGIGNLNDGGNNFPFIGDIDEISLYNRALSAGEIQAIYHAGSLGKCPVSLAPVIVTPPASQTVLVGGMTSFSVAAGGAQPLFYQWNFNGTNLSGATGSTLALTNIQVSQAGNYAVLVTNLYGAATSSIATLTVVVPAVPPTILAQTPGQIVLLGQPATFSVNASGSDPLNYFWSRDGGLIPGATNFSYTLNNAQLADSGSQFSCLVTNAYGFAASTNATLKVIDGVANDLCSGAVVVAGFSYTNLQSTAKATSFGDPVPGCVTDFGNGVWYQFTAPAAGRLVVDTFGSDFDTGLAIYTGSCAALTEVACNDDTGGVTSQLTLPTTAGTTYSILAGGYSAHTGNLVFHLNHLTPPAFVVSPTNQSVVVSSNASFSATLTGALPMSFQWFFNGAPLADGGRISGATNTTLNIAGLLTNDGGSYLLVASNIVGVTTSSVAMLTPVILPPVFVQPPVSQAVGVGSNANFAAVVGGTPPFSYQWDRNGYLLADDGIHIAGSATSSLSLSNLTAADAGNYTLTVTNAAGSVSALAVLVVMTPPAFASPPAGRSVPPGLPTTFNASATGVPAPYYQWQLNGTNISGWSPDGSFTIAAVAAKDLGSYQVVAQNSLGAATSLVAQLTFGPVAAWGRNLSGECLPPPGLSNVVGVAGTYQASFAVRADGTVAAWGGGSRTNIPASATNVVALFTDGNTSFAALRANGTIASWGGTTPPALSNVVSVALGFYAGFALRAEGTLVSWGSPPYGAVPAGLNHVTAVAAGYSHAIALRSDGTVAAWGSGAATNVPAGLANVTAIAAGAMHSLALKSNGTVISWGDGSGTNLPSGLTNIVAIYASSYVQTPNLCLAIRANGNVIAWGGGNGGYGETNPPAALSNLFSIAGAAAPYHGLALVNDGSPVILHPPVGLAAFTGRDVTLQAGVVGAQPLSYQWLLNGTNVPGATNTSLVLSNVQIGNAGNYQLFVSNSVNTALSLAAPLTVLSNNTLSFLGQMVGVTNYQGSKISIVSPAVLGNGPLRYQWFFSPTNNNYTALPGATNDTLLLDPALAAQSGTYFLVVSNLFGSAISPSGAPSAAPALNVRVLFAKAWGYLAADPPGNLNVTNAIAIAVGNAGTGSSLGHYLVLKSDGKMASWSGSGYVSYGETNVAALSNSIVTAIAAGYADSLALKSDGTVYAFGYNNYGETNVPAGLSGVTAIACGDYHDLALKADGTVAGWGQNNYGQATNAAATNVVAIAAGNQHSLALRADGSVVGWGFNGGGQTIIPATATNIIAIAAGNSFSVALRANGTVVQWGNGITGYPIPSGLSNVVAISASGNHCTALRNDGTVSTWGIDYLTYAWNAVPSDLANVVAIASGGDHDLALFGTRAPAFTVQPWNRTFPVTATTNLTLAAKCAGIQPVRYQWQLNGTNVPGATNDTLILTNLTAVTRPPILIPAGVYQLIASNAYGVAASKYAKVTSFIPLGDALNTTDVRGNSLYNWTTSGNAQWYGETNVTHDGVSAARSGGIGALQETILQTTVGTNWPGRYTFWWKVSSEQDFDILEFRLNGIVQTNISGEVDWQPVSLPVAAGTNVLMWRYSKDASFDAGQDAGWVDQFAFVPDGPMITVQPVSQTVNMGTNVTFQVTAIGQPRSQLIYQWRQNGNLLNNYQSRTLTWNNVGRAQNGTYFVTVTDLVNGGSTVSSNAVLKVLVPQLLATPQLLPNGSLQFNSTDANGGLLSPADLANFEAQASTNLVDWVTLPGALSLTNGMLQLQDSGKSNFNARYYRILEH